MHDTSWLPKTKLMPPQTAERLLPRPHLISRVTQALLNHRLTLLSAPAGYGKTTLAVQALQELQAVPQAWLRLSEDDNDLHAFLYAMAAAWDQLLPQSVFERIPFLAASSPSGAVVRSILAALINELHDARSSQAVLVLDDYHLITHQAVHDALMYLLEHSPDHLHILLTSREKPPLPLARLRVHGRVAEMPLTDLKFGPEEIHAYFRQLWHIDLSREDAERLHQRTEGWIASLHLFALALSQQPDLHQKQMFFEQFNHPERLIYQLMAEEVLERQPDELQRFLLETAVLTELSPRLCRAVTLNDHAPVLLEEAYRRNLFLTPVKDGGTYRYHDLFAEFLRHQLAQKFPERLPDLHYRAAKAHADPAEKIRHYLAARRWDEAAGVLEREGQTLLTHGYIQALQRWITGLPEEQQQNRPHLQYLLGTCALQMGDFTTAEHHLRQSLQGFQLRKNDAAEGQVLLMLANLGSALHDPQKTIVYLNQALAKPLQPHQRVQAHITSVWMHVYTGKLNENGRDDILQAMRITKMSGDPIAYNILGHQLRAPLLFSGLGVSTFEQYCREVLQRFGETATPASVGALCLLNVILFLKGNIEEARKLRHRAMQLNQQLGQLVYITIGLDMTELWDRLVSKQNGAFETYWAQRRPFYEQNEGPRQWLVSFLSLHGLQLFLNDGFEQARDILEQVNQELLSRDMPENHIAAETLSGLLQMQQKKWAEAEASFQQAIHRLDSAPHGLLFANPYIWLAHLYQKQGYERQVRAAMEDLFSQFRMQEIGGILLREGNVVGPLLEKINHLPEARHIWKRWSRIHTPRAIPIPQSPEALSAREMEVLRLMAQGARNQEIADALFITVRTVKAHVSRILAKMGVQSRTQAVAKARQLGLL